MKKIFTFIAAAMMAVCSYAEDTQLIVGGGWNGGFSGTADVHSYTMTLGWNGVGSALNIAKADYPQFKYYLAEPAPAGLQVIFDYIDTEGKTATQYGAVGSADIEGKTEFGNYFFTETAVTITKLRILPPDAGSYDIKIAKVVVIKGDGTEEECPLAPEYGCTETTPFTTGTVTYDSQWQQIQFPGLVGQSNVTVKVEVDDASKVQMCVVYDDKSDEYPQFENNVAQFTTAEGKTITTCGVQFKETGSAQVTVKGAWIVDTASSIKNINATTGNNVMYNLAGQRVNNAKGIVIMNGKKVRF